MYSYFKRAFPMARANNSILITLGYKKRLSKIVEIRKMLLSTKIPR